MYVFCFGTALYFAMDMVEMGRCFSDVVVADAKSNKGKFQNEVYKKRVYLNAFMCHFEQVAMINGTAMYKHVPIREAENSAKSTCLIV